MKLENELHTAENFDFPNSSCRKYRTKYTKSTSRILRRPVFSKCSQSRWDWEADLAKLLTKYQNVFSKSKGVLGHTDLVQHKINTGSAVPTIENDIIIILKNNFFKYFIE
jgi:hypothetical protein